MDNVIKERLAIVFDEIAKRYSEKRDEFFPILDENGKPIEGYGNCMAEYFNEISNELDEKGLLPQFIKDEFKVELVTKGKNIWWRIKNIKNGEILCHSQTYNQLESARKTAKNIADCLVGAVYVESYL